MEDIAAEARTSKTVIYRHFSDRAGLYRAVADKVGRRIGRSIAAAIGDPPESEGRLALSGVIGAYLALTEADPEVYRFVVRPPAVEGPVADAQVHGITDDAARILADWLSGRMADQQARVWATAIVGSVHACADRWLADPGAITRSELTAMLVELNWSGLAG